MMTKVGAEPIRVLEELSRRFDELTDSQKRIVEFIVRNPDRVAFMTLDKLADTIGVSPSTVVRFCYRLGYDGFTDMQSQVQAWLRSQLNTTGSESMGEDAAEPGAAATLFDQAIEQDVRNLLETRRLLRREDVQHVADLMVSARTVWVTGIRSTYGVAASLALGLNKVQGKAVLLSSADAMLPEEVVDMSRQDVLVSISFPRYSNRPLDVARYARERGVKIVGITDSLISPLARLSDVVLPCAYEGLEVQNSLTAAQSLVQAIVSMVAAARGDRYQERLKETEELITRWNVVLLRRRDQAPEPE